MKLADSPTLLAFQKAAVIALRPFACRDTEIREATTLNSLYIEAMRAKRTLATARFLAVQCGPEAASPMFKLTQAAFSALTELIQACELANLQEAPEATP